MNAESTQFHVFLSHNRLNTPLVRQLARALREQGMQVWPSDADTSCGRPWREHMAIGIASSRTAVICIGGSGIGPWKTPEMSELLRQHIEQQMPVIVVLLPGTPDHVESPRFLQDYIWIDLRDGVQGDGFEHLVLEISKQMLPLHGSTAQRSSRSPDSSGAVSWFRQLTSALTALAARHSAPASA